MSAICSLAESLQIISSSSEVGHPKANKHRKQAEQEADSAGISSNPGEALNEAGEKMVQMAHALQAGPSEILAEKCGLLPNAMH